MTKQLADRQAAQQKGAIAPRDWLVQEITSLTDNDTSRQVQLYCLDSTVPVVATFGTPCLQSALLTDSLRANTLAELQDSA